MKEAKNKIKEQQKSLAQEIRERRPDNHFLSWKFRHRHIAYCQLFNNTPYSSIEKPREGNEPDEKLVERWKDVFRETLRSIA